MNLRFCCALSLPALLLSAAGCGGSNQNVNDPAQSGGQNAAAPVDAGGQGGQPGANTVEMRDSGGQPDARLSIGSPAPPLSIASWYKGDKVKEFEQGTIYVVEFWATWCGPCRVSMPHLSELQKQYQDEVQVIGISDEEPGKVAQFMEKEQADGKTWDDIVQYTIALDRGGDTSTNYMKAAGQSGIPTAFVVGKDGAIEWIGHPMAIDEPLAQIVDGSWDRAQAAREFELEASITIAMDDAMEELREAHGARDWEAALAVINRLLKLFPEDLKSPGLIGNFNRLQQVKLQLLADAGLSEEFDALQKQLIEKAWDNPQSLNEIAWRIATAQQEPDLDAALRAAVRANDLTDSQDASVLDTLARVHFERGELQKAVDWQQKAVATAPEIPQLAESLQRFQAALKAQDGGEKPEGEKPEGEKPEGEKPEGEKPEGEKPEGEKPEGQKPEGQKPEGEKGEGQKGEGKKGEGEKGEEQKGEDGSGVQPPLEE